MPNTLNALEIQDLPTLESGWQANLKIDLETVRVWASRMTIADGEIEPTQIEELINGRWVRKHAEPGSSIQYPIQWEGRTTYVTLMTRMLVDN